MMQRIRLFFFYSFVIVVFVSSCKTQKSITKSTPTISTEESEVAPDSLSIAEEEILVVEIDTIPATLAVDSLVLINPKKDSIIISGVGDIMLGTNFPETHYLPPNQGRDMLAAVKQFFADADVVFGNLEGVLLDSGGTQKNCRNPKACYLFRSPEYMGLRLKEAGFNLFSVANNHAGDFGPEGRLNTSKVLDSLDIPHAGNMERPYTIFEKSGIVYGFAAFSPNKGTPNINDINNAKAIMAHLDSLVDIIIVSFHGGAEGRNYTEVVREHEYFYGEDRGDVYNFAHTVVDAGADVVFGHGPHVPRAIDIYKGRFIAYSLGNFATYARFNLREVNGLAPIVKVMVNSDGQFISGQIISCRQIGWGIPQFDLNHSASKLIRELTKKDLPEVELTIDDTGFISYLHP